MASTKTDLLQTATNGSSVYKEPAPIVDKDNPLESMMQRFDRAAEILHLEPGIYQYLKTPVKSVIVSIPIQMDDGSMQVFDGYRVIHNDILDRARVAFALLRM